MKFIEIVHGMGDKEAPPYDRLLSTLAEILSALSDDGNGIFTHVFGWI